MLSHVWFFFFVSVIYKTTKKKHKNLINFFARNFSWVSIFIHFWYFIISFLFSVVVFRIKIFSFIYCLIGQFYHLFSSVFDLWFLLWVSFFLSLLYHFYGFIYGFCIINTDWSQVAKVWAIHILDDWIKSCLWSILERQKK